MVELVTFLTPILAVDILNPVLFALLVILGGRKNGVTSATLALFGHTLSYLAIGITLIYSIDFFKGLFSKPNFITSLITGIIGALLILEGLIPKKQTANDPLARFFENISVLKAFTIGMFVNFLGIPFALPYFAAVDVIAIHTPALTTMEQIAVIIFYNLAYASPFLCVPLLLIFYGKKCQPLLDKINSTIEKLSNLLMPFLLTGLGVYLFYSAVRFFIN